MREHFWSLMLRKADKHEQENWVALNLYIVSEVLFVGLLLFQVHLFQNRFES
jgi:hypothetical protein